MSDESKVLCCESCEQSVARPEVKFIVCGDCYDKAMEPLLGQVWRIQCGECAEFFDGLRNAKAICPKCIGHLADAYAAACAEAERQKQHNTLQQQKNEQIAEACRRKDAALTTALGDLDKARGELAFTSKALANAQSEAAEMRKQRDDVIAELERREPRQ